MVSSLGLFSISFQHAPKHQNNRHQNIRHHTRSALTARPHSLSLIDTQQSPVLQTYSTTSALQVASFRGFNTPVTIPSALFTRRSSRPGSLSSITPLRIDTDFSEKYSQRQNLPALDIMPQPQFGALGMTFTVMRGLQAVSLISIIGMTANFISDMVANNTAPPNVLVGTLSVVSSSLSSLALHQPLTNNPTDLHRSPLRHNFLHPLLRQPAPLPHLHRRRLPPPHRRDRRGRHCREADLLPQLPSSCSS